MLDIPANPLILLMWRQTYSHESGQLSRLGDTHKQPAELAEANPWEHLEQPKVKETGWYRYQVAARRAQCTV